MVPPMQSLPSRIHKCAKPHGSFVLRSGLDADTYFDKHQFEADPQLAINAAGFEFKALFTFAQVAGAISV